MPPSISRSSQGRVYAPDADPGMDAEQCRYRACSECALVSNVVDANQKIRGVRWTWKCSFCGHEVQVEDDPVYLQKRKDSWEKAQAAGRAEQARLDALGRVEAAGAHEHAPSEVSADVEANADLTTASELEKIALAHAQAASRTMSAGRRVMWYDAVNAAMRYELLLLSDIMQVATPDVCKRATSSELRQMLYAVSDARIGILDWQGLADKAEEQREKRWETDAASIEARNAAKRRRRVLRGRLKLVEAAVPFLTGLGGAPALVSLVPMPSATTGSTPIPQPFHTLHSTVFSSASRKK